MKDFDKYALYEAVSVLTDDELDGLLTQLTALTFGQSDRSVFDTCDSLVNRVARDLDVAMRNHWQPDRTFLEWRTREQLTAIGAYKKLELINALLRDF
ncbi:MAG: hypothetical protein H6907_10075 [Hyphomicrobiales bacterium]|nr:hypothetical protein [Hyphomicrobiales bacterium]MCP5372065.1 hypothetical protein [Hyphomicrobiales bacterium]